MKYLPKCFIIIAVILSNIMVGFVSYEYCNTLWRIKYEGFSAPASIVFLYAIPFLFAITVCVLLAFVLKKKKHF